MKTFNIDMTPDSHLIQSVINTKITAPEAISELVDNSFDAGASKVRIMLSEDSISITDDGRGCADLSAMLTFGRHRHQKSTKLGRYGVGLKNAACGMGEVLSITTTHRNVQRHVEICWSDIEDQGWKSQTGQENDTDEPSGTTIEIGKIHRRALPGALRKELSFAFAPALWDGKEIFINKESLAAWTPPILSNKIVAEEQHDSLPISFEVTAGLTEINDKHPFVLAYEHRIIGGTTMPCKEYNTSSKFIALVKLTGEWSLLKHKDGLKEGMESEWLWDRLNIICGDLLRQVHQLSECVELGQISAELEYAMNVAIGKAKRPNRRGNTDKVEPNGTPRKVKEAAVVDEDGIVKERNHPKRGFGIVYCPLADGLFGKVDVNGRRVCIQLNEDHPFIQECRANKNLVALKTCAAFLLCNHQSTATDKTQLVLKFEHESESGKFMELASSVFSEMSTNTDQAEIAA